MGDSEAMPERFPAYSHEQQLEERSLNELRVLLSGTFVVRDQRSRDFGVDVTFEVVHENRATNYTTSVQVKARSRLAPNQDGSLSLRIESTNVEYLLSAAMSLVVLYDADRRSFYYARVLDEVRRLASFGVDYRAQESVTLRLTSPLTTDTAVGLRDEMLNEGRIARDLRHQLAGMSSTELLHVDARGVGVTTTEIEQQFFLHGPRLAARGELQELEPMSGLLSPSVRAGGRAQLLMAHAHACSGRMISAWMHASGARRNESELSKNDLNLLELIEIGCDQLFRRSTGEEVLRRTRAIRDRANLEMQVHLDVSALRQEMTLCGDATRFADFASKAAALAEQSSSALGPKHPATLAARVLVQDLSGRALGVAYARLQLTAIYGDSALGLRMRGGQPAKAAVDALAEELRSWFARNHAIRQDCAEWPLLALELKRGDLLMQVVLFRNTRLMSVRGGMAPVLDLTQEPVSTLLHAITELRDRAMRMGVDDVELHTRLLLAELFDLADDMDAMRAEANELVARARACAFQRIEEEARAYVEGRSLFRLARAAMAEDRPHTCDEAYVAQATSEERDQIANNLCELLQLPTRSREIVRDELERVATVHQLQQTFCRHFEIAIFGDPTAEEPEYTRRPACVCVCEPRHLRTRLQSPHWHSLVAEFRRNYCESCTQRSVPSSASTTKPR